MSYKVIRFFRDLHDFGRAYMPGDEFPRPGKKVTEERLKQLSSDNNLQHRAVIEKNEPKAPETPKRSEKPKKSIKRSKK